MASNDRNDEYDNLNATKSFTDPGGATHTGTVSGTVAASGTVTLSGGAAIVPTNVTTTGTHFDVYLDPSGAGANAADVKAAARVFWDNSAAAYKVEILEDGTSVGNPDIGYVILQR